MLTKGLQYFDLGILPGYFGFCTSKRLFIKEMKRLGLNEVPEFVSSKANATTHFIIDKNGVLTSIACISKKEIRRNTDIHVYALLAHEAYHVVSAIWDNINEKHPGEEVAAYTIQTLLQWMMRICSDIRKD